MSRSEVPHGTWIESDLPPRLDALGWSRWHLFAGYALSSSLMVAAAVVARVYGVDAERRSLEDINAEDHA